jgi:hypothetical protein
MGDLGTGVALQIEQAGEVVFAWPVDLGAVQRRPGITSVANLEARTWAISGIKFANSRRQMPFGAAATIIFWAHPFRGPINLMEQM